MTRLCGKLYVRIRSLRSPVPTCVLRVSASLGLFFLPVFVQQPRTQYPHRFFPVFYLRFFVLTRHDDPGRDVGNPHRRLGRVHALPSRSAGAKRVNAQVLLVNVHFHFFHFRKYGDRGGRRVDAPARTRSSAPAARGELRFRISNGCRLPFLER